MHRYYAIKDISGSYLKDTYSLNNLHTTKNFESASFFKSEDEAYRVMRFINGLGRPVNWHVVPIEVFECGYDWNE